MKAKTISIILFFILIPIISYADDYIEENLSDTEILETIEASSTISSSTVDKEPSINARHAVVIDRTSKQILYGKNEQEKCQMASTTKIMTAIVVLENVTIDETVTISSKASSTGGSRLGLSTNDAITVEDLLYGLMMRSRK